MPFASLDPGSEDGGGGSGGGAGAAAAPPTCRLCWELESSPPDGILMSPCQCKGSSLYIHRGCLARWLRTRPRAGAACELCRAPYDARALARAGIALPPPLPPPDAELALRNEFVAARVVWLQQLAGAAAPGGSGSVSVARWNASAAAAAARAARRRGIDSGGGGGIGINSGGGGDGVGAGGVPRRRWWARDPATDARFWAGLLHGAWRAAIAADGALATLALLRHRRVPAGGPVPGTVRQLAAAAARRCCTKNAAGGSRGAINATTSTDATASTTASSSVVTAAAMSRRLSLESVSDVQASFDGTTIWQVSVYTAAVALAPGRRADVAEACSGMALGAIIGGCLSSVAFLPLVGLPRVGALLGAGRLAGNAGVRLAAGLVCRPWGHAALAAALGRAGAAVGWAARRVGRLRHRGRRRRGPPPPPPPAPPAAAAVVVGPEAAAQLQAAAAALRARARNGNGTVGVNIAGVPVVLVTAHGGHA